MNLNRSNISSCIQITNGLNYWLLAAFLNILPSECFPVPVQQIQIALLVPRPGHRSTAAEFLVTVLIFHGAAEGCERPRVVRLETGDDSF